MGVIELRTLAMTRTLLLVSFIALSAGPVLAQNPKGIANPAETFMEQWDLDGDGSVSLAEARKQRTSIFKMFDEDGNGAYSKAEIAAIDVHKLMQLEGGMGPGGERPEGAPPPKGTPPQGEPPKAPPPGQAGAKGAPPSAVEMMKRLDTDGNGTVTSTEFVGGADQWFEMRDRNGDGVLTAADFVPPKK